MDSFEALFKRLAPNDSLRREFVDMKLRDDGGYMAFYDVGGVQISVKKYVTYRLDDYDMFTNAYGSVHGKIFTYQE